EVEHGRHAVREELHGAGARRGREVLGRDVLRHGVDPREVLPAPAVRADAPHGCLPQVVVRVDEPRHDDRAGAVDHLVRVEVQALADGGDAAAVDQEVTVLEVAQLLVHREEVGALDQRGGQLAFASTQSARSFSTAARSKSLTSSMSESSRIASRSSGPSSSPTAMSCSWACSQMCRRTSPILDPSSGWALKSTTSRSAVPASSSRHSSGTIAADIALRPSGFASPACVAFAYARRKPTMTSRSFFRTSSVTTIDEAGVAASSSGVTSRSSSPAACSAAKSDVAPENASMSPLRSAFATLASASPVTMTSTSSALSPTAPSAAVRNDRSSSEGTPTLVPARSSVLWMPESA